MRLQAPYPNIQSTLLLPEPMFSNVEASQPDVSIKRSMNGTKRTYVKPSSQSRLNYVLRLSWQEASILKQFVTLYIGKEFLLTDHEDVQWVVSMTRNPLEFTTIARDGFRTVPIAFEGSKL
ncbi:MAG: hypothetical protein HC888_15215 [Candidatus Competibacteraceae bacterium]|nr:hypothetical protein [Candidatus Competibacteraceae bacterium]